jgi:hypothetical protein
VVKHGQGIWFLQKGSGPQKELIFLPSILEPPFYRKLHYRYALFHFLRGGTEGKIPGENPVNIHADHPRKSDSKLQRRLGHTPFHLGEIPLATAQSLDPIDLPDLSPEPTNSFSYFRIVDGHPCIPGITGQYVRKRFHSGLLGSSSYGAPRIIHNNCKKILFYFISQLCILSEFLQEQMEINFL